MKIWTGFVLAYMLTISLFLPAQDLHFSQFMNSGIDILNLN